MSLPHPGLRSTVVVVAGAEYKVRELTASETWAVRQHVDAGDLDKATQTQIAAATDTPPDEVAAWWRVVPSHVAEALSVAINEAFGDETETLKSRSADVHAGDR